MQAPAKSSTKLQSAVDQGAFDFLMPFGPSRPLLRPDEVARCLGWSVRKVYELIQDGKLEAHALPERDKQRYQVTRRSVLLFLAETALYLDADPNQRIERLLSALSKDQLSRLIVTATHLRARL